MLLKFRDIKSAVFGRTGALNSPSLGVISGFHLLNILHLSFHLHLKPRGAFFGLLDFFGQSLCIKLKHNFLLEHHLSNTFVAQFQFHKKDFLIGNLFFNVLNLFDEQIDLNLTHLEFSLCVFGVDVQCEQLVSIVLVSVAQEEFAVTHPAASAHVTLLVHL